MCTVRPIFITKCLGLQMLLAQLDWLQRNRDGQISPVLKCALEDSAHLLPLARRGWGSETLAQHARTAHASRRGIATCMQIGYLR
jgi:hypothetical protein